MSARLIFLSGRRAGSDFPLGESDITIGRSPERAVVFDASDDVVSANHATIRFESGRYILRDEGSLNGTFVNNVRVVERELREGDIIDLGLGGPSLRFETAAERGALAETAVSAGVGTLTGLMNVARTAATEKGGAPTTSAVMKEFGRLVYERSSRRARRTTLALAVVAAVAIAAVLLREEQQKSELQSLIVNLEAASRAEITRLSAQADSLAGAFEYQVSELRHEAELLELDLERSEAELTALQSRAGSDLTRIGALQARVDSLRSQKNERELFQAIAEQHIPSIAFLYVRVLVRHPVELPQPLILTNSWGTGFFVDESGLLLTNKHVVEPLSFIDSDEDVETACMTALYLANGFEMAREVYAWRGGEAMRARADAPPDLGLAERVDVVAKGEDRFVPLASGYPCTIPFEDTTIAFALDIRTHAKDNHDLAVLAGASPPVHTVPIGSYVPHMLDPVMTLGFPWGPEPLEGTAAAPQVSLGIVRKAEETIQFDASLLGGNSGGPLFALDGNVIGVTTRGFAETHNDAIRIEHAMRLLERAKRTQGAP